MPVEKLDQLVKCLGGRVVSAPNFGPQGPGFESHWRQNSAHDCTVLHCTNPFIVTLPSSRYGLNNVETDIKYKSTPQPLYYTIVGVHGINRVS